MRVGGRVMACCGDKVPCRVWATHLNLVLPSTTWLTTIADVILETEGQAVRSARPPGSPSQPSRGSNTCEPPWEKGLWPAAPAPAVPENDHRASPLSLGFAKPGDPRPPLPYPCSPGGGAPGGSGLRSSSPSHTWPNLWSRPQSWFGPSSEPAGKPLPGPEVRETWPDLDPTPGRTLNLLSPHPRAS